MPHASHRLFSALCNPLDENNIYGQHFPIIMLWPDAVTAESVSLLSGVNIISGLRSLLLH